MNCFDQTLSINASSVIWCHMWVSRFPSRGVTWMSQEDSKWLGSVGYNLPINGVYWGYNPLILTIYYLPGTSKVTPAPNRKQFFRIFLSVTFEQNLECRAREIPLSTRWGHSWHLCNNEATFPRVFSTQMLHLETWEFCKAFLMSLFIP